MKLVVHDGGAVSRPDVWCGVPFSTLQAFDSVYARLHRAIKAIQIERDV